MMDGTMMNSGGMIWGMGLFGLLLIALLILAGTALVKYLFFNPLRKRGDD
ncbi:MAG: hypothetical protein O3C34_08505 [Proteobacteria bacterium]|nr:hypothetical protein [Pseudomonadota bacterium]